MAREATDVCLRELKESNKSRCDSNSVREQCIDLIPYYLSGFSGAHFFPTALLREIAIYEYRKWTVALVFNDIIKLTLIFRAPLLNKISIQYIFFGWFQATISSDHESIVTGVATQGQKSSDSWVKYFSLDYSQDGRAWIQYAGGKVNCFTLNKIVMI